MRDHVPENYKSYDVRLHSKRHNKFLLPVLAKAIYENFGKAESEISNVDDCKYNTTNSEQLHIGDTKVMPFKRKSIYWRMTAPLHDLEKYYCDLREYEYAVGKPLKGIVFRKLIHPILVCLISLDRMRKRQHFTIISDKRRKTHRPIIFACTHIGYDDVSIICEAVKNHAYIFVGDPKSIYKNPVGLLLYLNGAVFIELDLKTDRKIGMERSKEILEKGENLIIFPEGAWNITENLPVMKLFSGAVMMAMQTGAEIVPVAIEQYKNDFFLNIGRNIYLGKYKAENVKDVKIKTEKLRDTLCTLKWDIFEYLGVQCRKKVPHDYWDKHLTDIWGNSVGGKDVTKEEIEKGRFHVKGECSPQEVFAFKEKLMAKS